MPEERKIICTLEKEFYSEKDQGKLRVLFEILPSGIHPVNKDEFFCKTEQVFVTGGYGEIKERFKDSIFEAKCILSKYIQGGCL